ncbi:glycerol-3-phosphate dehydrogenase/oxidase [Rhodococcus triatomae]|uniref:Glycerol-3-phosphate dehydrogenase n=1 Tax=Rhodococcus triatomae TaxID=300028 RepID=A0A1G8HTR8_9NOCA|nr:glycerol-3-phosphate dehydrogenase/oxidase [Rhodococcus triatomae]QNG20872.1 glycerol-3-phosphate dehydrogenase/oxidase [Rhodococcus triatomae]QNG23213.1 glycerol-3-phosphate dehydrogenase/oxidase [Rhodococcus triatomae]SDI09870.1 glycerol-3-phosphate dehydrogenase [Rhodococcus triatomae]
MTPSHPAALHRSRRASELTALADATTPVDVVVIGGGITGAGIALDAATRGLHTVLVESRDLAFGTSRWSSKLVHGGLRYLATGNVGIARRSSVERGILMTRTAPHLVRALPQLVPLLPSMGRFERGLVRTGFLAGDALRIAARTPSTVLPRSRRVDAATVADMSPTVRRDGLDGGYLAHDGQLVDDARLVVAVARTAARYGAKILTRVRASDATGTSVRLTDELSGESFELGARTVINATGVWAGEVDESISLRPSRGTHLVFDAATFGNPTAALTVPIPGETNRFVFVMPEQLGRVYLGLTDEEAPGPVPDVPTPTDSEIGFLLDTINTALATEVTRADVTGAFAGLRPLIDTGEGHTADVSRDHAVLEAPSGLISVVGGKLTEYRYMAEDTLDRAIALRGLDARACRTRSLPLVGAPAHAAEARSLAGLPASLVARYGTEARTVLESATCERPDERVADGIDVTRAEFEFAVTDEGALDASDILDRRTRIGLVAADRARAEEVAAEFVAASPR